MNFGWSLSDSKSPQVSRSILSILADLNNAVVWIISTRPLPNLPVPVLVLSWLYRTYQFSFGGTVIFMFYSFFQFFSKVYVLIYLFAFFQFTLWSVGTAKSTMRQVLLFFFFWWLSWVLAVWLRFGDLFVSQNFKEFSASYFLGQIPGCAYTICLFGQIQTSCTIASGSPSPSSRVYLYTFCSNVLHSLIIISLTT